MGKIIIKENEYQCVNCKGIFQKGWGDEEMEKEAKDFWGEVENPVIVCDDCFKIMTGNGQAISYLKETHKL